MKMSLPMSEHKCSEVTRAVAGEVTSVGHFYYFGEKHRIRRTIANEGLLCLLGKRHRNA